MRSIHLYHRATAQHQLKVLKNKLLIQVQNVDFSAQGLDLNVELKISHRPVYHHELHYCYTYCDIKRVTLFMFSGAVTKWYGGID